MQHSSRIGSALAVSAIAVTLLAASPAAAEPPFSTLLGSWNGTGQVRLEGGKSETIKCKAYYTSKDGGQGLSLAFRCASASNKIEMRATLASSGSSVSGNWEERTFNAAGNVSGKVDPGKMSLAINGGGLSGSMSVSFGGNTQSVLISTEGSAFKGLRISLLRG